MEFPKGASVSFDRVWGLDLSLVKGFVDRLPIAMDVKGATEPFLVRVSGPASWATVAPYGQRSVKYVGLERLDWDVYDWRVNSSRLEVNGAHYYLDYVNIVERSSGCVLSLPESVRTRDGSGEVGLEFLFN